MPSRRLRSVCCRLLVAAFALWLPAATGQGGKATCVAATALAKSLEARPHLSCHGENGAKSKDCCCRSKTTLRAAACGCHDGAAGFGTHAHDPMLTSSARGFYVRPAEPSRELLARDTNRGRTHDAPDPPPPQTSPLARA